MRRFSTRAADRVRIFCKKAHTAGNESFREDHAHCGSGAPYRPCRLRAVCAYFDGERKTRARETAHGERAGAASGGRRRKDRLAHTICGARDAAAPSSRRVCGGRGQALLCARGVGCFTHREGGAQKYRELFLPRRGFDHLAAAHQEHPSFGGEDHPPQAQRMEADV